MRVVARLHAQELSGHLWARQGECAKNPSLLSTCPVSCGTCTDLCLDKKESCPQWAANGDCAREPVGQFDLVEGIALKVR